MLHISTTEAAALVAGDDIQDLKYITKSTGTLMLKTIVAVSDIFPPLKSAAAGLKIIIEQIQVSPSVDRRRFVNCLILTGDVARKR